jgi:hypothetical protein
VCFPFRWAKNQATPLPPFSTSVVLSSKTLVQTPEQRSEPQIGNLDLDGQRLEKVEREARGVW